MGKFSITVIKSKHCFILPLSLDVTIVLSVLLMTCNNVIAQTVDSITEQRKAFENNPQIPVGISPSAIGVNEITNKIYVTNTRSGTVSVIDSNSGSAVKNIRVGEAPDSIAVDYLHNKIYVANTDSNTVSVIDGNNDSQIAKIPIGKTPRQILFDNSHNKIYVANTDSNTVSVINTSNDTREPHDITVGLGNMVLDSYANKIYVANTDYNTVSVINTSNDTREPHDITVGFNNVNKVAVNYVTHKIYVVGYTDPDTYNGTVSVINASVIYKPLCCEIKIDTHKESRDIPVGKLPKYVAVNGYTGIIYIANYNSNTVSVIDGSSDKLVAGIILNNHPANSGKIICGAKEYPTNIYLYVGVGTNCIAQHSKDFEFSGWVENLPANGNSSIPLESNSSGNLTVNRYGTFTANFKPVSPPDPTQFLIPLYGIIASSLIGWSIPSIIGRVKTRTQLKHLEECIDQIGKLDKNAIEDKIKGYYVHEKISEDHRQYLKDKISEYYESTKKTGSPL